MSIQSEITRLSGNVSDALDAIEAKGVTIPSGANSDDLATLIGQISGGGGGTITQDQDGYLVLSPDGGGGGGGGLEYEEGTWTPTVDIQDYSILFTNTHTSPPFFFTISDENESELTTTSTPHAIVYMNWGQIFGDGYIVADQTIYGLVAKRYRNATNSTSGSTGVLLTPYTDSTAITNSNSRFWASETSIRAYYGNAGYYWRAGRTYKWIAVWAPTT